MKRKLIHSFFSSFSIPAYEENSVPKDASLPYIMYSSETAGFGESVILTASAFSNSSSWESLNTLSDTISDCIGRSGLILKDGTTVAWIRRGNPFSATMSGESTAGDTSLLKRMRFNIEIEFITD